MPQNPLMCRVERVLADHPAETAVRILNDQIAPAGGDYDLQVQFWAAVVLLQLGAPARRTAEARHAFSVALTCVLGGAMAGDVSIRALAVAEGGAC